MNQTKATITSKDPSSAVTACCVSQPGNMSRASVGYVQILTWKIPPYERTVSKAPPYQNQSCKIRELGQIYEEPASL